MKTTPFYVGQKVVCIDNATRKEMPFEKPMPCNLTKGAVYTVAAILPIVFVEWGVLLVEIKSGGRSEGYKASRFAPVQESFEAITFERVMEEEKVSVN